MYCLCIDNYHRGKTVNASQSSRTLTIASISLLILFAVIGLCYRFQMDDLYYTMRTSLEAPYERLDALGMMRSVYEHWNGRYSTIVIQTMLATFEPLTSMLLPGLMIGLLTLMLRAVLQASPYARLAWLAPVWMCCWIIALPGRNHSIFWVSAVVSQYIPLLFAGLAALLILKGRPALWLFPMGLITGGFSEITTLTLMWLPLLVYRKRGILYWWAGMGIALIILVTAPGAAVRLSYGEKDWMVVLQRTGTEWLLIPERVVTLPGLLIAFLTGYLFPEKVKRQTVLLVWMCAVLALLSAMIASMRGAVYSFWTLSLPVALLVIASWLTGCYFSERKWRRLARLAMVSVWVGVTLAAFALLADRVWFVSQWEARDSAIRSGQTEVRIIDGRDSFYPPQEIYLAAMDTWYGTPLTLVDVPDW